MAVVNTTRERDRRSELRLGEGLNSTRAPLPRARHVPGYIYHAPEVLDLEKEQIFLKDWLCVARVEEIESPGDYMTFSILDEPVIVVRNDNGQLNAFANVCSHRGVEVVQGSGNIKSFSCPYHGWSYDLDGQLTGASYMDATETFDPADCGLPSLKVDVWADWVFITFDNDAPPLAEFVSEFDQDFGMLRQQDCRLAAKIVLDLDCNWKFAVENIIDVYHVTVLHGGSFGKHRGDPDRYPLHLRKNGGTATFYDSAPMTPDGKTLFATMPWLEDKPESFACSGHLAPNMHIVARSDNVHPFVMWPVTPSTCRVINYLLFPKEWSSRSDYADNVKIYDDYMRFILDEDVGMIGSLQRAMSSRYYRPGMMSKLENGVHHVLTDHLNRLFGPD